MLSEGEFVATAGLRLRAVTDGATATVEVEGEIDLATADDLANVLIGHIDGGCPHVTVDMSEVTFMDSTGLKALLRANNAVPAEGAMVVRNPSAIVSRVLAITGVDQIIRVELIGTNGSPEPG